MLEVDLIQRAEDSAQKRADNERDGADYAHLAELSRRLAKLDEAGLGPGLARIRAGTDPKMLRPVTIGAWSVFQFKRTMGVLSRLLFQALGMADPLEALYEMMVQQVEAQLEAEKRSKEELAELWVMVRKLERRLEGLPK